MTAVELLPIARVSYAERAEAMNAAYADYHVALQMTPARVQAMDALYDVAPAASLAARSEDGLMGLALLSQRGARGWVSAVGVIPPQRRQGIARRLMEGLIANARGLGMRHVTLEVIEQNTAARELYRGLGFVETRELLCWRFPADADLLPIPRELLAPAGTEALWPYFAAWHDQPPCWQREEVTLRQMAARARAYMLTLEDAPAGYCLVNDREDTVSLLDVGIHPQIGPVAAGRVLLQALASLYPGRPLALTNVPADSGLNKALAALHFLVAIRQREMRLELS